MSIGLPDILRIILSVLVLGSTALAESGRELPPSIAHYRVTDGKRQERLDILRTPERIEHHHLDRGYAEVWQRDSRGELSHWKVFPREQRTVHYTAGDLRTIHAEPEWEQLATLLHSSDRDALKSVSRAGEDGARRAVLEGEARGMKMLVIWDSERSWAKELVLGSGKTKIGFRLLSSASCSDEPCRPIELQGMRELEFADLGDMERDPFVRRFLASFSAHTH